MSDQRTPPGTPAAYRNESVPSGNRNAPQQSPNQQKPPADNERRGGTEHEQSEKIRRSNLAGDQDTDDSIETEEG